MDWGNIWASFSSNGFISGLGLMIISSLATTVVTQFNTNKKRIDLLEIQETATKNGTKALLRSAIVDQYEKYIKRGYFPLYSRENVDELYKEYKTLLGNGVIDVLLQKLYALPTEPTEK